MTKCNKLPEVVARFLKNELVVYLKIVKLEL